jgi:hypothetical protein
MAEDPARAAQQSVVTPLPRIEDLPILGPRLDEQRVRDAFPPLSRPASAPPPTSPSQINRPDGGDATSA